MTTLTDKCISRSCTHRHDFQQTNPLAERNTLWALALTVSMMVIEIAGGYVFGSMALLADGWHMGTHAFALGLTALAYFASRHYKNDTRFAFGTWKIEVLAAYTSSISLFFVAISMLWESCERLLNPVQIDFAESIAITCLGLAVNLLSLWLLDHGDASHQHHHSHAHHHAHNHGHGASLQKDLNLKAAYLHVATDAATSVLALVALLCGLFAGLTWMDPLMGIVGGILVGRWAVALLKESATTLLDINMHDPVVQTIRDTVSQSDSQASIHDLHVWKVGSDRYAVLLTVTHLTTASQTLRENLMRIEAIVHLTLEELPSC